MRHDAMLRGGVARALAVVGAGVTAAANRPARRGIRPTVCVCGDEEAQPPTAPCQRTFKMGPLRTLKSHPPRPCSDLLPCHRDHRLFQEPGLSFSFAGRTRP